MQHQIKVLIFGHDPHICQTLGLILERHGYSPQSHTDPQDALDVAETKSLQLALIDLDMLTVQGLDIVAKLKELDCRMSCIVMTSNPSVASAIEAMRRGSCDYLAKPFEEETLIRAIQRACKNMGISYADESEFNRLVGLRIRSHRLEQGLTLRQISERTNLTTSQISQVELGKNAASIWALARISNSLGLQLNELLEGL